MSYVEWDNRETPTGKYAIFSRNEVINDLTIELEGIPGFLIRIDAEDTNKLRKFLKDKEGSK